MEVNSQLDIAVDLNYITKEQFWEIEKQIKVVASLISGLRNKRLRPSSL